MSTALYVRRPRGPKNNLYVLGKTSEDGPSVLCVASASGIKTLPLFSKREAARRFLRATPLRFGLLGSGWRPRRILGSELGSVSLLGLPDGIRVIALDLSPEVLVGGALQSPYRRWLSDGRRRVTEGSFLKADADPDQIHAQLEEETGKEARKDVAPTLAPDVKRALLAAYEEAQALGSSYIGPEHVLLALASDDDEGEAGRLLSCFGLSHTGLRGAIVRRVDTASGEAREPKSSTPTLDEYSRDLTEMAREGKLVTSR